MRVVINGTTREVADEANLDDVLRDYGVPERGVAVAMNGSVVPRAKWNETWPTPDASIDVLTAVQGG